MYRSERYGFWALSRFDDVVMALRDWTSFTSTHGITLDQLLDPKVAGTFTGSIIFMDPPDHDRMRKLVSRVFTPRAVAALEPLVRRVITGYLDPLAGRSHLDLCTDFAGPFPVEVISRDPRHPARRPAADPALARRDAAPGGRHPGDDPIGHGGGHQLQPLPPRAHARRSGATSATTCSPASSRPRSSTTTTVTPTASPTRRSPASARCSAAPAPRPSPSWSAAAWCCSIATRSSGRRSSTTRRSCRAALEEILRYWAPAQYQGRFTTAPVTLHGVTIPQGQPVLLLTGSATRDERAYADADRFDIERPAAAAGGVRARHPLVPRRGAGPAWRAGSPSRSSSAGGRATPSTKRASAGCRWSTSPASATCRSRSVRRR